MSEHLRALEKAFPERLVKVPMSDDLVDLHGFEVEATYIVTVDLNRPQESSVRAVDLVSVWHGWGDCLAASNADVLAVIEEDLMVCGDNFNKRARQVFDSAKQMGWVA